MEETQADKTSEDKTSTGRVVKCSICGKTLQPIGNVLNDFEKSGWTTVGISSTAGWEQWLGTVCSPCRRVYCPDCCDARGGPCPKCGQDVKPAMASFLP